MPGVEIPLLPLESFVLLYPKGRFIGEFGAYFKFQFETHGLERV
jgi:hypothetical protein